MSFINDWITPDFSRLLRIEDDVMEKLLSHRQVNESDLEGGGILLGHRRGPHFHLTHLTAPQRTDQRTRNSFTRDKFYHSYIASKHWHETNGQLRYVGEWHTHPEDNPTPSVIDISEWVKLAQNRVDQEPMATIIVGRKSLSVELVFANTHRTRLVPTR